jgi:hypothetical protein
MNHLPKIAITSATDERLEVMLKAVNDGFDSGRVTKMQLASWIINEFHKKSFAKQIDRLRKDHFDKIAHLKSVIKQMEKAKKSNNHLEMEKLLSPLTSKSKGRRMLKPSQAEPGNNLE